MIRPLRRAAAVTALALLITGVAGASSAQPRRPALIGGGSRMSLADAQRHVSFVIYLPVSLPKGAGAPRFFFAPERVTTADYVPERVYAVYANGMTLWQMPALGSPLMQPSLETRFGDRSGWISNGPGKGRIGVEWVQGRTQLGLSARLSAEQLFKIAGSAVQAAPTVRMAAPSAARKTRWGAPTEGGARTGGIGVTLAPGMPGVILAVEPGLAAARAGLAPGDEIASVDDRPLAGTSLVATMQMLRGRPGTAVRLMVSRAGAAPTEVTLQRQVLPVYDVEEMTVAQARAKMPFTLLTPRRLPSGYRLLTVSVQTRDGRPVMATLVYSAPGRPLLLAVENAAPSSPPSPAANARPVTVGGAAGWIDAQGGMVDVAWTRAGTGARVQGQGLTAEQALQVANSMR